MAVTRVTYGGVTAITLTGTSLANFAAREGTLVVNTTNLYMDAILSGYVTVGAAAATGNCYILFSSSDATTVSYPATGSNASIVLPGLDSISTLTVGQQLPGTGLVYGYTIGTKGVAATTAVGFENLSVAQCFGGNLPPQWAPVLVNCQGQAFDATAGHTVINYNGITYTTA